MVIKIITDIHWLFENGLKLAKSAGRTLLLGFDVFEKA
jgi:hypothetical protein